MPSPGRLVSLDAIRGFTIAAMIVANFPGREQFVYFTLRHTRWNGLSFTDKIAHLMTARFSSAAAGYVWGINMSHQRKPLDQLVCTRYVGLCRPAAGGSVSVG